MQVPPKRNIITKSAVLLLKEPSSSILQYLYVKIMLKKKLKPKVPKNRNVVTNRHSCPCFRIKIGLKYSWKGVANSSCFKRSRLLRSQGMWGHLPQLGWLSRTQSYMPSSPGAYANTHFSKFDKPLL